jgi:hypothetical protein
MNTSKYNYLQGDIRMVKISLENAEKLLKTFNNKWIYIKFISNTWECEESNQSVLYSKFKIGHINIDSNTILIYGTEDDDRLVISKDILVQSECTHGRNELRFIQKSSNTMYDIYIKEYLPTANLRFDEITHSNKNLIITEGKTDWKHLKNALSNFKIRGEYQSLAFEFFEYEDDVQMGNSTLLNICKYQSLFKNEYLKVFIFDSDEPNINNAHKDSIFKYYGNNVYSLILPVPLHRKTTPLISTENYYTDDEIKTLDINGRRLFLANEFDKETCKHLTINNVYGLDINKNIPDNHILDNKVYKVEGAETILKKDIFNYCNKQNIALTKNDFAENILNKTKPFDKISVDTFRLVFDILTKIQKDSLNNIDLIEISKNVYLEEYDEKKILHIYAILKNKYALEFRNHNLLQCVPTVSDDQSTLFLEFEVKTFSFKLPILISENLIEFLISKSENFSNRIELHILNENNEIVSNKELFQGENTSSVAMTIILKQLFT